MPGMSGTRVPASSDARRIRRAPALDGLRGWAALVVLLHHSLLTVPAVASTYLSNTSEGPWVQMATSTPLHLVWAGPEAVIVFFVLSEVVRVLAHQRRPALAAELLPAASGTPLRADLDRLRLGACSTFAAPCATVERRRMGRVKAH